ncbi:MAG: hypothetical protein MSG64_09985 [Pyrinomonadaceae bacterium MAG19_C2-C3]|nr:hypothetical protein [Pyrinomonadaceae bacterium MAG19_C2-C3]
MYCPQCGQNQVADDVRYCSRCGFLLVNVAQLLATGGVIPQTITTKKKKRQKTRRDGVRQGVILMMLATIIVPLIAANDGGAEAVAFFSLVGHLGGLLRIIYSLLFLPSADEVNPNQPSLEAVYTPPAFNIAPPQPAASLPPHVSRASLFDTARRNTGELVTPRTSVTDHTTRLLKQEPESSRQRAVGSRQSEEDS